MVRQSRNVFFKPTILPKTEQYFYLTVLWSNCFVRFLEESRIAKSPFEMNWPLVSFCGMGQYKIQFVINIWHPFCQRVFRPAYVTHIIWKLINDTPLSNSQDMITYMDRTGETFRCVCVGWGLKWVIVVLS